MYFEKSKTNGQVQELRFFILPVQAVKLIFKQIIIMKLKH